MPRYLFHPQSLIPVPVVLSDNPSLQEILWNFSRFKDERRRLTLRNNPHFYVELPTSPEEYGDCVKIDPTEDFRHANKFYVVTDKPEPIYIKTDQVSQVYGNIWYPKNAFIFKGLFVWFFVLSFVSDVFPDIHGRLMGESIVKASLRGSRCGLCKRLRASTVSGRGLRSRLRTEALQPIITKGFSSLSFNTSSIGGLPMHSYRNIGLCICTGQVAPDSPVRCDIITYSYLSLYANINIALRLSPFATNV